MKLYLVLVVSVFICYRLSAGLPPTTLSGQNQTDKPVTFNFSTPYRQATKTSATTSLIETGNDNALVNPSFEASNASDGWTVTTLSGTFTASAESTNVIHGLRSLRLTATSGTGELVQTSTINSSQLGWHSGIARVFVRTTLNNVQVCSVVNSAEFNCVSVENSGDFREYVVPFVYSASLNYGIKVKLTASATGSIFVDAAYVGLRRNLVYLPCQGRVECEDVFSAKISSSASITNQTLTWLASCTNPSTGNYNCSFATGVFSLTPACVVSTNVSTGRIASIRSVSTTNVEIRTYDDTGTNGNFDFELICQRQGADFSKSKTELAVVPENSRWFVSASFTQPFNLGSSTISSPQQASNSAQSITLETGSSYAEVTCSGSNPPTGSTCAVGDETSGIAFTPPHAGFYKVCAAFYRRIYNPSAVFISGFFVMYETPLNSSSILQTGSSVSASGGGVASLDILYPHYFCSIFYFSSNTKKAIRIMRTQTSGGSVSVNEIGDFRMFVEPFALESPRPILTGSEVVSPGSKNPAFCSAKISSSGVISDQIGGCFLSCTNATTPVCTFVSGYWKTGTVPNCWGLSYSGNFAGAGTVTSTTFSAEILNSSGVAQSGARAYFCHGVQND